MSRTTLDGAPATSTCDQCARPVPVYRHDEPGRQPLGPSRSGWYLAEHNGRQGGCYAETRTCVMSDRESSHLQHLPRDQCARP